jgi:dTDP-4-amino-4,6-dideoxygalactose transaminase
LGKTLKASSSLGARLRDDLVPIKRCNDFVKAIFNFYFDKIPEMIRKKEKIAREYVKHVKKIKGVFPQLVKEKSAWMNYSIRVAEESIRDELLSEMKKRGILCDRTWHELSIHSPEIQRRYRIKVESHKNAHLLSQSILNLPLQHTFEKEDIDFICHALEESLDSLGD